MNCLQAREAFPELLDARTAGTAHREARAHLAGCLDCQREFSSLNQTLSALDAMPTSSPTPQLRKNFYAMLGEEKSTVARRHAPSNSEPRARRAAWLGWVLSPIAAAALVTLGFQLGRQAAPATVTAPSTETVALRHEIKSLQEQVSKMGQLVGYSLLQQQQRPASERLRGVRTSAALENPTDEILNELISSLALDASANVRLGALEALYPHAKQEVVRGAVLASLAREQNPLVQISMIDFLAAARDREAALTLERISTSEAADPSVREAAKRALTQL